MKDLIRLISIANRLDNKGLTVEADKLDRIIRKIAQHDKEWDALQGDKGSSELDRLLQGYEDENPMEGPSDAELGAMEMGVDVFRAEEDNAFESLLEKLNRELELFSEAAGQNKLTGDDIEVFERIKNELADVQDIIAQRKAEAPSFMPEA